MGMIDFFWYKNPKTGEMISDQRMKGFEEKPLTHKGIECKLVRNYKPPKKKFKELSPVIIDKNREVWQVDPDFIKQCRPKYVKLRNGEKVRYDPTKHC